jgi:hypothetical protein
MARSLGYAIAQEDRSDAYTGGVLVAACAAAVLFVTSPSLLLLLLLLLAIWPRRRVCCLTLFTMARSCFNVLIPWPTTLLLYDLQCITGSGHGNWCAA